MGDQPVRANFVQRHLDPASRLGEILFGLIMVLTATLTAGLTAESGKAGVRQLLYGALACFWLVFVSCLPAALPFLIFGYPTRALRVSNLLLIAMLFFVGHQWAQYAHTNRLVAGLAMVAIGLALVGVAVLLGG